MGNNKHDWSALSLKDKADLFKIYINNGISDLNTIVKHYNAFGGPLYNEDNPIESFNGNSTIPVVRYDDGGDINYQGQSFITREQFLDNERQKIIDNAYENSMEIEFPRVPIIQLTQAERDSLESEYNHNVRKINAYNNSKSSFGNFIKTNDQHLRDTINRNLAIEQMLQQNCRNGSSCTYTATSHYGDKYQNASSQNFVATNNNNTFKEVDSPQKGDIVISFMDNEGVITPHHTLMFSKYDENGVPRYNASNGGDSSESLRFNQRYPKQHSFKYYRFVGDEEDNNKWNIEYNKYVNAYNKANPLLSVKTYDVPITTNYDSSLKINKFENGTKNKQDSTTEERYNVFTDPLAEESRKKHKESLEAFVKNNPEIAGITTADFVEFLNQLSGLEGTYDKDAGEGKIYSGYYGLKGGRDLTADEQHRAAYKHLAKLFKESIVKEDVAKGKELGFTPAQVLLKYWNQGNRVTNYLHNSVDDTDGLNTKISEYGWNLTSNINYDKYLKDGVTGDYVIVKDYKTLGRTTPLVRNSQINYSNRDSSIADINTKMLRHKKGKDDIEFEPRKLHVGDTIWLKLPENMMSNIQPKNAVNPTDSTLIQPVEVIQPTQPVTSLVKDKTISIPPVNTFDYGGYTGTQTVRPASENNKPYDPNFVPSFVTGSSNNDDLKEQNSLRNDKEIIERLKQQAYNNLAIQDKIKNHPAFNNKTSKIREDNTKAKQYSERFFDQEIPEGFNNYITNGPIDESFFNNDFSKIENSPLIQRQSSPLSNKAYEEMLFLDRINNTDFGNNLKSGELTNVELDYQKVEIDGEFYDLIYSKNNVDNDSEDPIAKQAYDSGEYLLAQDGFGEFYINNYKDFYKQHYGTKFNNKNANLIFDDALKQHIQDNIESGNFINLVKFGRVIEGLDDYKKLVDSGEKTWDEILTEFEDKDFDILKHVKNDSDKVMLEMFAEAAKPEYDYFTDSQKIAMLTNAYHESDKFRTDKQHNGGPAKGYFQFEKEHQNEYNKFLEKNNLTDSPANQFKYVAEWMLKGYTDGRLRSPGDLDSNNYSNPVIKRMVDAHKGYTTAIALKDWDSGDIELATKAFEALYEKAGIPHIDTRMKNAKKIQSLYNVFKYLYS